MTPSSMKSSTYHTQLSLCLTLTVGQQNDIHFASIPCTQREMSDDEVLDEIQDGLNEAEALTLKDIKATTIA